MEPVDEISPGSTLEGYFGIGERTMALKKILYRMLCLILLLSAFLLAGNLNSIKKQEDQLIEKIRQSQKNTHRLNQETVAIQQQLNGWEQEIKSLVLDLNDPLSWCYNWIRNQAGLFSDIQIEFIGQKPPSGMKSGRETRKIKGGTVACLIPCAIRLDLPQTTLVKLLYVLEQIESLNNAVVIQYLKVEPLGKEHLFSATAILCLPSFIDLEDQRAIRKGFASPNRN